MPRTTPRRRTATAPPPPPDAIKSTPSAAASFAPIPPAIQSKFPQEQRGIINGAPKCELGTSKGNKAASFDPAFPPLPRQDQRKTSPPPRSHSQPHHGHRRRRPTQRGRAAPRRHLSPRSGSNPGPGGIRLKPRNRSTTPRTKAATWHKEAGNGCPGKGSRQGGGDGRGEEISGGGRERAEGT